MSSLVTLDTLARYLDRDEWRYDLDPEGSCIRTGFRGDHATYRAMVLFDAEKQRVRFIVPNYLNLTKIPDRARILERLMELNMQYILLKFGFDPADGEVRAEIDVPVNDSNLSYEGFRRCLYCLLTAVDEEYPEMMRLMWGAEGGKGKKGEGFSGGSEGSGSGSEPGSGSDDGGKSLRKPRL
ncbi:MAG TPA: YbjN domain-containing protein [Planctomycetota bacterium]|nr:YbjN domain-containing protein [Planctomycetota bacterium]